MVVRMSDDIELARRAYRLLSWYPHAWRQRYGAEFVDLMEQEFAENPHNLRRSSNIVLKGTVARLRELGLVAAPLNSGDQSRPIIATVFAVAAVYLALALNFWSVAMLDWNGDWRDPASTAVTIWTGAVTVFAGIVVVIVAANVVVLLWSAVRDVTKRYNAKIRGPLVLIFSSILFLGFALRSPVRFIVARGGIVWLHPGQAIKQVAGVVQALSTMILWIWMSPRESLTLGINVVYGLIPVALLVLSFSVATLIRRSEFSARTTRFVQFELLIVTPAMVLFVISYFGLIASENRVLGSALGQPLSYPPLVIEFGVMTVMAALGLQGAKRLVRNGLLRPI
jgi:hypothetical protein